MNEKPVQNPVGFNLLAWSAVVSPQMNPLADRLRAIGYDGVECFISTDDVGVYRAFGEHLRQLQLACTCVTVVGPEHNPADPSPKVRQAALDHLRQLIDRAEALGATVLCGPFHSAFATFSRHEPQLDEYARSAGVLHAAAEHARQARLLLCPEALNRFECYLCNTMEQLAELVRQAGHPCVRAMFDTHHANIEEKRFPEALRHIAPLLSHVHISENDRGTPGSGHVPFDEVFRTLAEIDYRGWLTIEAFTRNDVDFANSIGVWRQYNDPWDIAENGYRFIREMQEKYRFQPPDRPGASSG